MNLLKNPLSLAVLVGIYFSVAWFFPWETIQFDSTISVSYVWDVLFALLAGFLYKMPFRAGRLSIGFIPRLAACLALAAGSVFLIQKAGWPAPFRYLERPVLQLLILAPLLEEFVFRYALLGASLKALSSRAAATLLGAVLFSVSHIAAVWHLPAQFHPFIAIQLGYTFVLGWIISKAMIRSKGVAEPVILHFLFNLCFYWAMERGLI